MRRSREVERREENLREELDSQKRGYTASSLQNRIWLASLLVVLAVAASSTVIRASLASASMPHKPSPLSAVALTGDADQASAMLSGGAKIDVTVGGGFSVSAQAQSFGLRPVGIGRGRVDAVASGPLTVRAGRATANLGRMTTWFRIDPSGLEEGFTVTHRPAGSGMLRVVLRATGSLIAKSSGPLSLSIRTRSGDRTTPSLLGLTYGDLRVTDAHGRLVPARLRLGGHLVQIVVADGHAVYPLTIDPTLSTSTAVGSQPIGAAITPNGADVYVANHSEGTVSEISTVTDAVIATITVGSLPTGVVITPNGADVYVANSGSSNVSEISTLSNAIVATIPASSPYNLAVTPDGSHVYVGSSGGFFGINVITTATNVVVRVNVGLDPISAAITPDGSFAYVPVFGSNAVDVLAIPSDSVVGIIAVGVAPYNVAISPDGAFAYVTNSGSNTVSVIDTSTNVVVTTINVGSAPYGVAVTPDGAAVLVTNAGDGSISDISTSTDAVVATVTPEGATSAPHGVAIANDGSTAFVANSGADDVSVLSLLLTQSSPTSAATTLGSTFAGVLTALGNVGSIIYTTTVTSSYVSVSTVGGISAPGGTPVGSYTVSGSDRDNAGDIGTWTFVLGVGRVATRVALIASVNPATIGTGVTYTATVSSTPDGGTVAFSDNSAILAGCGAVVVDISSGTASCLTSYSAAGSHAIVAAYSGDTDYLASSSSTLAESVAAPPTTVTTVTPSTTTPAAVPPIMIVTAAAPPPANAAPDGAVMVINDSQVRMTASLGSAEFRFVAAHSVAKATTAGPGSYALRVTGIVSTGNAFVGRVVVSSGELVVIDVSGTRGRLRVRFVDISRGQRWLVSMVSGSVRLALGTAKSSSRRHGTFFAMPSSVTSMTIGRRLFPLSGSSQLTVLMFEHHRYITVVRA